MLDALRAKREGHVNTEHISIENKKQQNKQENNNKQRTKTKQKTDKQALFTVQVTLLMFEEDLGDLRSGPRISTKEERGEGSGEGEGGGQKWKAEMRKAEFLAVGHMLFSFF